MYPDPKFIQAVGDGKIYIMGKPSGGENLPDDISHLKRLGITGVVSLLEREEAAELGLTQEGSFCQAAGINFQALPLRDRGIPTDTINFTSALEISYKSILAGGHYVAHCRAGIGRSGIFTSAILMLHGLSANQAIDAVSAARGFSIPDTQMQIDWLQENEGSLNDRS